MTNVKDIFCWSFFLLILYNKSAAQQYDKVWAVGSFVTTMSFDGDSIALGYLQDSTTLSFETIGSMCDSNGNFLFYSNGLAVYNRYGNIMPNGDSLNYPSEYYSLQVPQGEASEQGMVIVPYPGNSNEYCIFHFTPTDTSTSAGGYEALNFYYSIVDMTLDSGRGDLISKNVPLIQDVLLSADRVAACRHANGRDWWIIKPVWYNNIYYEFLLTPDGILGPYIQQIGPVSGQDPQLPCYSSFSPDGSKYATVAPYGDVILMDFDRCTGLFSNPDSFFNNDSGDPINNPISGGVSLAFSPSGRFLYIDIPTELNQYDLWSTQIHDSIRIRTDTEFYQMNTIQLAPNGKIYVSCWDGGSYAIHVINEPDSLGLACDFQFLGQPVLSANAIPLPYFPNYRLGALTGSPCDTLTAIESITDAHPGFASVAPNPASDQARIVYYTGGPTLNQAMLYDITGQLVWSTSVSGSSGNINMDISGLSSGVYLVRFTSDGNVLMSSKLMITK